MKEMKATWQPIKTAPKDNTLIDLWHPIHGRMTNYRRANNGKGDYYWPIYGGLTLVRDATHWMPVPGGPDDDQ